MPEPDLIDSYLGELRRSLRTRPDVDDVVAEVQDHLREAADRLQATGVPRLEAERSTIERFGQPALLATAFTLTSTGGLAMPTTLTRAAGAVAVATACCWLIAGAAHWWASELFAPFSTDRYAIFGALTFAALVGTLVVLAGVLLRAGRKDLMVAALVLGGVLAALFAFFSWMWPVWGLIVAVALAGMVRVLHTSTGDRATADWAVVIAWPAGFGMFVVLNIMEVGPVDEWGDFPAANTVGFVTAASLMAVGLVSIGRRLLTEQTVVTSRSLVEV